MSSFGYQFDFSRPQKSMCFALSAKHLSFTQVLANCCPRARQFFPQPGLP